MAQTHSGVIRLIPPEVFVGDRAQIQFTFKSAEPFPTDGTEVTLAEGDSRLAQTENCTLAGAKLEKGVNGEYTVTLTFIPWKTGTLALPAVNFGENGRTFTVTPPPALIRSLAEKTQATALKPPAPPLLVPGTTYAVYGIVLGILIAVSLLVALLVKIRAVSALITAFFTRARLSRNYKRFARQLRRLEKKALKLMPADFAALLEKLLRGYFSGRYGVTFESATTSDCVRLLEQEQTAQQSVFLVQEVFTRCDFVRFCAEDKKNLAETERLTLVKQAAQAAKECEFATL